MRDGYQNKSYNMVYDTEGTQSGLTDLSFAVYDPLGAHDPLVDVYTATEIGNTGVYKAVFTPTQVGTYVAIAGSALSTPLISDKAGTFDVMTYSEADTNGVGFVTATDSLEALSNQLAAIAVAQGAPAARGRVI